jgi:hypothetical protein
VHSRVVCGSLHVLARSRLVVAPSSGCRGLGLRSGCGQLQVTWSHLDAILELGSDAHELAARSRRVRSGASGRQPLPFRMSRMLSSESRRLEDLSRVRRRPSSSAHPPLAPPPAPSAPAPCASIALPLAPHSTACHFPSPLLQPPPRRAPCSFFFNFFSLFVLSRLVTWPEKHSLCVSMRKPCSFPQSWHGAAAFSGGPA